MGIRHADSGKYLLDPEGIYVASMEGHPRFRVLSSLRFKVLRVRLVSCWEDSEVDVLQCRRTKHIVKLSEEGPNDHNDLPRKILVIRTHPCPNIPIIRSVKMLVEDVRCGRISAMLTSDSIIDEK